MTTFKLEQAQLPNREPGALTTLHVKDGKFSEPFPDPCETLNLNGLMVLPGLIETHIHLDKACILSRCQLHAGTLQEAIAETSKAKSHFTEEDIYQRGASVLRKAIVQGTTHMRTHVEIDPGIGLKGFKAVQKLKRDFAWAITLELCVFPQEGLLNNPGTQELLCKALADGADVLGGCPYMDSDPNAQIETLFEIATGFDKDLDFHLDFDLDPNHMTLPKVIECTQKHGWQGRVTVGHVTKLAAIAPSDLLRWGRLLARAGVQVTALPSTDLFLNGRNDTHNIPRGVAPLAPLHSCGVTCSISSNNIGNPFTPYGDASLIRQANLYANISHLGTQSQLETCLAWVSTESARLLGLKNYGLEPGCWADFLVLEAQSAAVAVAEIPSPIMAFKRGRQTFSRPQAEILSPP